MKSYELNEICKDSFLELVSQTESLKGYTYCFFRPFKGKDGNYHITISEKSTGFGTTIPLSLKTISLISKNEIKQIYIKILKGLLIAIEKHKNQAHPVDYVKNPIKANNKYCMLEKVINLNKSQVEVYNWSKLIY